MESIWHELTPERIFKSVEAILGESLTNVCIRRNSYINRVYELEQEDNARLIVKFYRPGRWSRETILAEHDFLAKLKENDLSIITPLIFNKETLFNDGPYHFSIFPKKWGRPMDEFDQEGWQTIGRLIAKTLKNITDDKVKNEVKKTVRELTDQFPLYPGLQYDRPAPEIYL